MLNSFDLAWGRMERALLQHARQIEHLPPQLAADR
jgi:hypothetical protein